MRKKLKFLVAAFAILNRRLQRFYRFNYMISSASKLHVRFWCNTRENGVLQLTKLRVEQYVYSVYGPCVVRVFPEHFRCISVLFTVFPV